MDVVMTARFDVHPVFPRAQSCKRATAKGLFRVWIWDLP